MLSCSNQQCEGVFDGTEGAADDFDIVDELRGGLGGHGGARLGSRLARKLGVYEGE
jgi:hypothetical protein